MSTQPCRTCGITKSPEDFSLRSSVCKPCKAAASREARASMKKARDETRGAPPTRSRAHRLPGGVIPKELVPKGQKQCSSCRKLLPLENFGNRKGRCRPCDSAIRASTKGTKVTTKNGSKARVPLTMAEQEERDERRRAAQLRYREKPEARAKARASNKTYRRFMFAKRKLAIIADLRQQQADAAFAESLGFPCPSNLSEEDAVRYRRGTMAQMRGRLLEIGIRAQLQKLAERAFTPGELADAESHTPAEREDRRDPATEAAAGRLWAAMRRQRVAKRASMSPEELAEANAERTAIIDELMALMADEARLDQLLLDWYWADRDALTARQKKQQR